MLAILAPGQGSQAPNLFKSWVDDNSHIDQSLRAKIYTLIKEFAEQSNLDLKFLGAGANEEEIRNTKNAQPLLFITGLIGLFEIFNTTEIPQQIFSNTEIVFAGHSVGEVLAFALSGKIELEAAWKLVCARGEFMSNSAIGSNTGMSAILGGDRSEVIKVLDELGLTAANENGGGQIVAAGDLTSLNKLEQNPPPGSRIRPLVVAGAFHTKTMEKAQQQLAELSKETLQNKLIKNNSVLLTNKDGAAVVDSEKYLELLVGQVAGPVRWDLTMDQLKKEGVTGVLELPPAGVLSGLMKRNCPDIEICTMKDASSLVNAREFIIKHSPSLGKILGNN